MRDRTCIEIRENIDRKKREDGELLGAELAGFSVIMSWYSGIRNTWSTTSFADHTDNLGPSNVYSPDFIPIRNGF